MGKILHDSAIQNHWDRDKFLKQSTELTKNRQTETGHTQLPAENRLWVSDKSWNTLVLIGFLCDQLNADLEGLLSAERVHHMSSRNMQKGTYKNISYVIPQCRHQPGSCNAAIMTKQWEQLQGLRNPHESELWLDWICQSKLTATGTQSIHSAIYSLTLLTLLTDCRNVKWIKDWDTSRTGTAMHFKRDICKYVFPFCPFALLIHNAWPSDSKCTDCTAGTAVGKQRLSDSDLKSSRALCKFCCAGGHQGVPCFCISIVTIWPLVLEIACLVIRLHPNR